MATVQRDSIATLQVPLDSLHTLVKRLESQLRAKTSLPEAHTRTALAELLNFINTHPETASHRLRGELLVLTAGLFTACAILEGDSRDCHNTAVEALQEIELFRESKVKPLLREFSEAKISALGELKEKFELEEEATEQEKMARSALQKNSESIAATSKHLDDVQSSLNNMAYQMEELTERRREIEEKHREAKERRQAAASSGGGYRVFSLFAPVMAPVAAAASALATRATDSELRRLSAQIEGLRRHTEGLNPALIEISLKDLNIEHEALQRGVENACAHCAVVASEKENAQAKVDTLEEMQSALDKVCMSLGELQSEVGGKVGESRENAGIAAHLKLACAQAIANMARMGYDEARRWAVGLAGNMLEVVEDVELRELLDTINPIEEDEGIESGGEESREEERPIGRKPENEYDESEAGPSTFPVPEITVSTPENIDENQQNAEQLATIAEGVEEDPAVPSSEEEEEEEADHKSFVLDNDVDANSSSASSQHTLAHEESGSDVDEDQTPVLEPEGENAWADDDDDGAPLLVKQEPAQVVDVVPAAEKMNVTIQTTEITLSLPGAF